MNNHKSFGGTQTSAGKHAGSVRTERRLSRAYLTSLLLLVASAAVAVAQSDKRPLTLEWIFGAEGRAVASVPPTTWLDDGSLVIFDTRRTPGERTFEKLNPATGQRAAMVDAVRALADLKSVAAVDSAGRNICPLSCALSPFQSI